MNEETFFERVVVHTVGQVVVHSIKKIITFFKFTPSEAALSRFAERPGERVSAFFVMMKLFPPPLSFASALPTTPNQTGAADPTPSSPSPPARLHLGRARARPNHPEPIYASRAAQS